jgi:colanic acid/amylovoran biosynthesis protein
VSFRILIVNTHSTLNAGDAAIVLAQIRFLRKVLKNADITLTSRTPKLDRTVYSSEGVRVLPPILPAPSLYRGAIQKAWGPLRDLAALGAKRESLKAVDEADLVIASGGGYFWSNRRWMPGLMLLQNILPIRLAGRKGKPIIFFPQSFGPVFAPVNRRLLRKTMGAASVLKIFAREQRSADFLRDLILDARTRDKVEICPDLAFLLEERSPKATPPEDVFPLRKPVVALTLRAWDFPEASGRAERRKLGRRYFDELELFCAHIIKKRRGAILIYPQAKGPGSFEDDRPISREFWARLQRTLPSADIHYFPGDGPTSLSAAEAHLARADLVLATRLHSAILALIRGVPAPAIGYQPKTGSIMARLGLDRYSFEIDRFKASDLTAAADDILDAPAAFRDRLRPRLAAVKNEVGDKLERSLALWRGKVSA